MAVVVALQPWVDPDDDDFDKADRLDLFLWWLELAIPAVGYLGAIVMTVRRSTTRLGQGMLIGLTLMLPIGVAILFGILASRSV